MIELTAITPCAGLLPRRIGRVALDEVTADAITSVAPFKGAEQAASKVLQAQIGASFPGPNRATGNSTARAVWSGRGQALVLGPTLAPIPGAAVTDQTDAWAWVALEGPDARDVLARLVPVDMRDAVFAEGHVARTLVGHMHALVVRTGSERYEILVFRSMAGTLVHDLTEAMTTIAALRGA